MHYCSLAQIAIQRMIYTYDIEVVLEVLIWRTSIAQTLFHVGGTLDEPLSSISCMPHRAYVMVFGYRVGYRVEY